jgi:hypothetical protein
MRHVAALARDVAAVLAGGAAGPDPAAHGLTTAEERATCGAPAVAAPAQRPLRMPRMHPAVLTAGGLRPLTWTSHWHPSMCSLPRGPALQARPVLLPSMARRRCAAAAPHVLGQEFRACVTRRPVGAPQSRLPSLSSIMKGPCCRQWPGVTDEVAPPHAGLRLYGAAAFERCLQVTPSVLDPRSTSQ